MICRSVAFVLLVGALPGQSASLPTSGGNGAFGEFWQSANQHVLQQCMYPGSALAFLGGAVQITRLRWYGHGPSQGGTMSLAEVKLGHMGRGWNVPSTVFSLNRGPDLTSVYAGPVTIQPVPTTTRAVYVDVTLTTPFIFFPAQADLLVEVRWLAGGFTGGTIGTTAYLLNGPATNVWRIGEANPNNAGNPVRVGAPLVDLFCSVPSGVASSSPFGSGCYLRRTTVFEMGALPAVATTGARCLRAVPNAIGGYDVSAGTGAWQPPQNIGPSFTTRTVPLGFTFPFTGGSTTNVAMSERGYVWLGTPGSDSATCSGADLARQGPRIAVLWGFNLALWTYTTPTVGMGNLCYDRDPVTGGGVLTWLNLANIAAPLTIFGRCTFQLALEPAGAFEMRWAACQTSGNVLVGWSPGNGALEGPGQDLLATMPFATRTDSLPPTLRAVTRPVLGTTLPLETTWLPPGSLFGGVFLSFAGHPAGLSLAGHGMPGCVQYAGLDAMLPFVPAGSSATANLVLPGSSSWSGTTAYAQSFVLVPGANAVGVQASNGARLLLGIQ